ncbi:MAG: DUF6492 family protein [Aestuariivirga sp.]
MNDFPPATSSWAIVTPSYSGDFDLCRLLCDSMDKFVVGPWHHYIIVERVDLKLFKPLAGLNRTILIIEDILPKWIHHIWQMPFSRRRSLWWSWKTGFMVGWHIQQLVKMQMAFVLKQDGLILCDSDMFFVKPFDVTKLHGEKGFRFYRTDDEMSEADISNPKFTLSALRQLGLPTNGFPARTYVDSLVVWRAETVRGMCEHIAKISGRDWRAKLGRDVFLSEYTLYGLYVDRVAGLSGFDPTSMHLCRTQWQKDGDKPVEVDAFVTHLPEPVVAVAFQSFLNLDHHRLRLVFDRAVINHTGSSSTAK